MTYEISKSQDGELGLARVERAFRSLKTFGLRVRPIFHWKEARGRAHLLVCMLAYYLEWHLRRQLAPLLFSEEGEPQHAGRWARCSAASQPSARIARARRPMGACRCRASRTCWRDWASSARWS